MTITPDQLADWKALAEKATEGQWIVSEPRTTRNIKNKNQYITDHVLTLRDAAFIAAARTAVPALIEEVERLKTDIEWGENQRQRFKDASEKEVRGYGFEPMGLQAKWRGLHPFNAENFPKHYDQSEVEAAIIDALCHEGIPAWHGDATGCVEQIVRAQFNRAEKAERELEHERPYSAGLEQQLEADIEMLYWKIERLRAERDALREGEAYERNRADTLVEENAGFVEEAEKYARLVARIIKALGKKWCEESDDDGQVIALEAIAELQTERERLQRNVLIARHMLVDVLRTKRLMAWQVQEVDKTIAVLEAK